MIKPFHKLKISNSQLLNYSLYIFFVMLILDVIFLTIMTFRFYNTNKLLINEIQKQNEKIARQNMISNKQLDIAIKYINLTLEKYYPRTNLNIFLSANVAGEDVISQKSIAFSSKMWNLKNQKLQFDLYIVNIGNELITTNLILEYKISAYEKLNEKSYNTILRKQFIEYLAVPDEQKAYFVTNFIKESIESLKKTNYGGAFPDNLKIEISMNEISYADDVNKKISSNFYYFTMDEL